MTQCRQKVLGTPKAVTIGEKIDKVNLIKIKLLFFKRDH